MPGNLKIAIDGPAGSGKSTVARAVARHLGLFYVDTGAMYRAVTYLALRALGSVDDPVQVARIAAAARFSFVCSLPGHEYRVWCDGEDVTPFLRTPEVARAVARVAALPEVRHHLVLKQQRLARGGGVVMEGRDIGTVVLPDADYKFFLTAAPEVRLARREQELRARGEAVDREALRRELAFRDRMDRERTVGRLEVAPDAVVIDCTSLGVEDVVKQILAVCGGGAAG